MFLRGWRLSRSFSPSLDGLRFLSSTGDSLLGVEHVSSSPRAEFPRFTKVQGWVKDGDPNIKKLRDVFSPIGKSERSSGSCVVLEGKRIIGDALRLGLLPSHVMFSRMSLLEEFSLRDMTTSSDVEFYETSYRLIQQWSSLKTPTGLMASFPKEDIISLASSAPSKRLPVTLILDNVRGPDNMGTILRSAAACGVSRILTTPGSVDVWNEKCLRGACGAHFTLPILQHIPWSTLHRHLPGIANVALADIHRRPQESGAISDPLELRKTVENIKAEISSEYYETDPDNPGEYVDTSYAEESVLGLYERLSIPQTEYWNFGKEVEETVILIGGETEGISPQARKFVLDRDGSKYFIPLLNGIESLNVGAATSILLFEVQKSYKDLLLK